MKHITTILSLALCILLTSCSPGVRIVENSYPKASIIVLDDNPNTMAASGLLQDFVQRSSGALLPIATTQGDASAHIFISTNESSSLAYDGFRIRTDNSDIHIEGRGAGAVNAVVRLLEQELGVRYWAGFSVDVPEHKNITISEMDLCDAPAFRYRQSQSWSSKEDPTYKLWHGWREPEEVFIGKLWVHTFGRLLNSDIVGREHPEWYALVNGKRRPGSNAQWCLTNEELFEAVCKKLEEVFEANPGLKMISVSQNDGTDTYCTCPSCQAIYDEEGAVSGAYLRFVNRLAERFPDKEFSTLAYLFSMKPPKITKPLPNVNIMLCDIDCRRQLPLTETDRGREFVKALEGWSPICDNIFMWDYGINFDNFVSPFPNFHVLQPNIQLFRDHGVKMHFAQVAGTMGTDFCELRAYMLAKLMWNPDLDARALQEEFMHGYYGAAGKYLLEYLDICTSELIASGKELWIYDSPISHKDGFLNAELRKRYNELFDKAEEAVASDPVKLKRVRISRLPLQYSDLEIARTMSECADVQALESALALFEERTAEYGVPTLNERNNRPADYCKLYRERFMPGKSKNLASGAKVSYTMAPSGKYAQMPASMLVDGLYGGTTFVESWIGWEGVDGEIILDLGRVCEFNTVYADFLHQIGAWILLPKGGCWSGSKDGESWQTLGTFSFPDERDGTVKFEKGGVNGNFSARYLKLHVDALGLCPSWHYGVGHPCWFFIDEIVVK